MSTVLDLPEEQQKKIAERRGMSLGEWRENAKRVLAANAAHVKKIDEMPYPEGMTPEIVKHFADKMASSGLSAKAVWTPEKGWSEDRD